MTHEGQGIYVLPLYYISLSAKYLYHNTVTRFYKVTRHMAGSGFLRPLCRLPPSYSAPKSSNRLSRHKYPLKTQSGYMPFLRLPVPCQYSGHPPGGTGGRGRDFHSAETLTNLNKSQSVPRVMAVWLRLEIGYFSYYFLLVFSLYFLCMHPIKSYHAPWEILGRKPNKSAVLVPYWYHIGTTFGNSKYNKYTGKIRNVHFNVRLERSLCCTLFLHPKVKRFLKRFFETLM